MFFNLVVIAKMDPSILPDEITLYIFHVIIQSLLYVYDPITGRRDEVFFIEPIKRSISHSVYQLILLGGVCHEWRRISLDDKLWILTTQDYMKNLFPYRIYLSPAYEMDMKKSINKYHEKTLSRPFHEEMKSSVHIHDNCHLMSCKKDPPLIAEIFYDIWIEDRHQKRKRREKEVKIQFFIKKN